VKRVVYHRLAADELISSARFYEERRPFLGEDFLGEVELTRKALQKHPESGRVEKHHTRSYRVHRFPFRVIYQIQPDRFWVVAIAHLSRQPGYWVRRAL
jgi:mRNA-degrading endonuclease RelE of RelBE toxin-antitoxin system